MVAALDSDELAADCATELRRQPPLFGMHLNDAGDVKVAHGVNLRSACHAGCLLDFEVLHERRVFQGYRPFVAADDGHVAVPRFTVIGEGRRPRSRLPTTVRKSRRATGGPDQLCVDSRNATVTCNGLE